MKAIESNYSGDHRPIWAMTVDEFTKLVCDIMAKHSVNEEECRQYLYGLDGISKEFGVGHNTAQRLKDGVLKDAVLQAGPGCKVIIDLQLARKLYKAHKK